MIYKRLFIATLVLLFIVGCSKENINLVPNSNENTIISKNHVVAHRGAWKKNSLPQNSIASLKEAIRLECKGSEFDIVLTADDSLVISHDRKYNNLEIQKNKYADLITLKLSNGEKLPTLREYILAGKENNRTTKLICELKNYGLDTERAKFLVSSTEKIINELNAQKYIIYISFDYNILKQLRMLNSSANIQYLNGDLPPEQLKLDNISGADYGYYVYKDHFEWIAKAKAYKLNLGVWTVNDSENMDWFLGNDFDFITTDEPEILLSKSKMPTE
ncbi:glycerophosphodiester phosphodiesterase family protein [Flavobacterium phragmitis]|uniref:Glycerophosphoryl diester phosphodiesterase n=1 Tax=Flavobacterium phragmitis TaxID=739143 RepID=A0A1I1NTT7_9FLAO|nr:glycerophosphodiester phosphodiesterase family protein [Flavobacterium phragmitis]SFD00732.1 glycerophosphoryl diester phosphodiesterase [Flavobacterium phragmitis]